MILWRACGAIAWNFAMRFPEQKKNRPYARDIQKPDAAAKRTPQAGSPNSQG